MQYEILRGDCIEQMRALPDASFDSIVTDPPYELGFMGKSWDASGIAYNVEMWREALRVLKPGGHLLAFSGSRTYHRMTCAIEDAGFEVRDQIFWVYSSGFPKSHNLDNHRGKLICGCTTDAVPYTHGKSEPQTECDVHSLLGPDVSAAVDIGEGRGQVLQSGLPEQSPSAHRDAGRIAQNAGCGQSSVEGRGDDVQAEGQLQGHPVRAGAGAAAADGAEGRLHNGASNGDGPVVRLPADADGSGAPRRPRSDKQPAQQSGAVAGQSQPQAGGAWPICTGCALPVVPQGLGTALKPAHEPICVARKPLVGTVAANVLQHGTGAINIDGCRVPTDDKLGGGGEKAETSAAFTNEGWRRPWMEDPIALEAQAAKVRANVQKAESLGRWPANLIHDGSDEVVALFPEQSSGARAAGVRTGMGFHGADGDGGAAIEASRGSAARFFYCAKASKSDRGPGNNHPTVKPLALMRYLCRLVTPPGGHILEPFAGSGSTIVAGLREGFQVTGIELADEYADIAERRAEDELYGDIL